MSSAARINPAKRRTSRANAARQPAFLKESFDGASPKSFTVRAPPASTPSKQLRHVRRIYLNQAVMKNLGLILGDLVMIRRKNPDSTPEEDAIETAFGVAWPSTTIDIPIVHIHAMLRQSHLIYEGDKVTVEKYTGHILAAKELSVCCIDEKKPGSESDDQWSKALTNLLQEIKYITEGMDFECSCDGRTHAFTVVAVIEDKTQAPSSPHANRRPAEDIIHGLDNMSLNNGDPLLPRYRAFQKRSNQPEQESESSDDTDDMELPDLFSFDDTTAVTIDHRPQSAMPAQTPRNTATPKAEYTPSKLGQPQSQPQSGTSTPRPKHNRNSSTGSKSRSKNVKSKTDDGSRIVEIDSDEEAQIIEASSMPRVTYDSIGGLASQIASLREIVELPLQHPHIFTRFGMSPPRGVLLYGPPGTGKTMLLRAIATETSARVFTISGPSIVSKYMGEAEEKLRTLWKSAEKSGPSIIFVDEIDAITPKRDNDSGEAESRLVASFLTLMDGMNADSKVVIIGATNRPNSIDPALRRPGRFDREIEVGIPDARARLDILKVMLESIPNSLSEDFVDHLAAKTHGFVGADLAAICRESVMITIKDGLKLGIPENDMTVREEHIVEAYGLVRPSAMREIFLETPKTKWSDIGGQELVRQKLRESVEWPLTHAETFKRLGITPAKGVLLFGPPGCSKTLTAKALASEAGLNFIAVKGPELFNKYIGEAEKALREIFRKARAASPSIIFFDEIDALSSSRSGDGESSGSGDRLLTTLLNEIDGIEDLVNVTILAATNRPDVIDSALLRPGRLDRLLYVGPPDLPGRYAILKIHISKMRVSPQLDLATLADSLSGCSGAEIAAFCRDAGLLAMQRDIKAQEISSQCFHDALPRVKRGITKEMIEFYEAFAAQYALDTHSM